LGKIALFFLDFFYLARTLYGSARCKLDSLFVHIFLDTISIKVS